MATYSSTLVWKIPWMEEPGQLQSMGLQRVGHNRVTSLSPSFCCSLAQSCPTLCDPADCCTPGFPVHHHLPDFAQTHAHRVGDAIQPFHPLPSPSPPALDLSQHQGLLSI